MYQRERAKRIGDSVLHTYIHTHDHIRDNDLKEM